MPLPRGPPKLPVQQFSILALVRFSEPIALTSVYPYLPAMIQSFPRVKDADVGFWTGTASAIFSLAQCLTAISWGKASDRYGRKPIILLGLFNTMLTSLLWGFSTNLPMALFSRALSGAGNGNIGIIRTMVAELCPWKELQPRAFSIMPLVYSAGSVLGPSIGGALANPYHRAPQDPSDKPWLLWKFPYALPNLVSASFFLVSITIGILFMQETLESRRHRPDYGLILGYKIIDGFHVAISRVKHCIWRRPVYTPLPTSPTQIRSKATDTSEVSSKRGEEEASPSYASVLTPQTTLYLVAYFILAMHNTGFDQIISVFLHHPNSGESVGETVPAKLKFSKGFGLDSSQIGVMFTLNGLAGTFCQFFIFPPVARKYGILNTLKVTTFAIPLIYFVTPFTVLIDNQLLAKSLLGAVWFTKSILAICAFPCCTILLTNSATSLKVLGTVNGIATSVGAIGRAVGPTVSGAAFTWGATSGYLITPFWLLGFIGMLAWIPLLWMFEGEGFGNDDDESDSDQEDGHLADDEDEEGGSPKLRSPTSTIRLNRTSTRSSVARTVSDDNLESDDEVGPLLGREQGNTLSSRSRYDSMSSAVFTDTDDDDVALARAQTEGSQFLSPGHLVSPRLSRTGSQTARPGAGHRRSSTPIGMGPGFRRLSSNLGVTRSGFGSGSELG